MKKPLLAFAALLLFGAVLVRDAHASCPGSTITTPTVIAANDLCYENLDVVVQGVPVTIIGPHTFNSLTLQSGATVTHVAADNGGLDLTITANCSVDATSAITVNERGYAGGAGPGSPGNVTPYCGGAAYGGEGGDGSGSAGSRAIYGSVTQPASLGSGGGWYSGSSQAGAGGGAVHLLVNGTLNVDGAVTADGGDATAGYYEGGGSGGSVWLSVGTLTGAGLISSNGGAAGYTLTGGGGGGSGGRVAVYYATSTFTGQLQAIGSGSGAQRAGAGTVLTQQGSARATITIANPGGDLSNRRTIFAGQPVTFDANIVVKDGGVLAPADQDSLWLSITGDLTVEASGWVSADRRGFAGGAGPGTPGNVTPYCGGAAYGGDGGDGGGSAGSHSAYGSTSQPRSLGSGGGWYSGSALAGAGGGSLRLTVAGTLRVDGVLMADGGAATNSSYEGGGSGGSLWLEVGGLSGTGAIRANGGAAGYIGSSGGGGGSGGRIAIYYTTSSFVGSLHALGGAGAQRGGGGTVLTKSSAGRALISVMNTGADSTAARTTFPGDPITPNADVVSTAGGRLAPLGIQTFYSLGVIAGGTLTSAVGDTHRVRLNVTTNCTVDGTSAITVNSRGYTGGTGPGSPGNVSPYCGGAAYGGEGGDGGGSAGSRAIYGSVTQPTSFGSGGGWYSGSGLAGVGGGAVHLVVNGTLHVDGAVTADGGAATAGYYEGGGSGGSVWLSVGTLEGAGRISANGGAAGYTGSSGGGGGSGGRVAVYCATSTFTGQLQAIGSGFGTQRGGAGTVLTQEGASRATITIANPGGDLLNRHTIFYGQPVTFDANIVVKDGGVLAPADQDSLWLSLTGDLTVEASGWVSADRRGFAGGAGPGSPGNVSPYCGGAAYGGDGGDGSGSAGSHAVYGSTSRPRSLGSGGGWYSSSTLAGVGGGSLRLTVAGTLRVDGVVMADGSAATIGGYEGGGTGGSLWLEVGGLTGTGVIRANGGAAGYPLTGGGGGGSGGRIAIYSGDCLLNFNADSVQVNGGAGAIASAPSHKGSILFGYANSILAGLEDRYLAPTEPASPSANLVAGLSGVTLVPMDGVPINGAFAHTFTGIPSSTDAAKVVVRVKAGPGANVGSDRITLGYSDGAGFHRLWTRYLGSPNGTSDPGLTGQPWVTGKDTTLVIDVRNLPYFNGSPIDATNLIAAQGQLDLVVEGNTAVDYALLTHGNCGSPPTGIGDPPGASTLPSVVALRSQPNPFRQNAQVTFELPRESTVRLAAYDISGRRVQVLYDGVAPAGVHQLTWRTNATSGGRLQAGIYFLRLDADGRTLFRKVVVTK